ncbi:S8 family peptidase [Chitinophagaceae bacterium 26-R-25]|nr:S8 family peptidase [Chitinophagaceae bacterium 26-R-25]
MKKLIFGLLSNICCTLLFAQQPGWLHKDLMQDTVFGISTGKAYEFLKGKKNSPVVVAVIDAGIDTAHEDLKSVLWVNKKERKGNKKDDDRNHYVDDVNGWSFLGSSKGNVQYDNLELTRQVRLGKKRFGDLSSLPSDTNGLAQYKSLLTKYNVQLNNAQRTLQNLNTFKSVVDTILLRIGKKEPELADVAAYEPQTLQETQIKATMLKSLKTVNNFEDFRKDMIDNQYDHVAQQVNYGLNLLFDPRELVGDSNDNVNERYYGTDDVTGPDATHGTHVAGIIGAVRGNGIGVDGVADNVRLMVVRAVPTGDERDKDVANAIRYAVDNGARVINMSFGKPLSPDKSVVDDAVRYAMSKDVLLVHASGNDALDLDVKNNFPNRRYADGSGSADAWIEVGASGPKDNLNLPAFFSNFGQTTVDVFAPGVGIYSAIPGSKYQYLDGTSMAAPVVAGIAALIREYYPKLTAVQVKDIIMRSVVKVNHKVLVQGNKTVDFSSICISGGVVNAYEAVKLAQQISDQQ